MFGKDLFHNVSKMKSLRCKFIHLSMHIVRTHNAFPYPSRSCSKMTWSMANFHNFTFVENPSICLVFIFVTKFQKSTFWDAHFLYLGMLIVMAYNLTISLQMQCDIVSLAHKVSFWAQKLTYYVIFWIQKTLIWADFCSNGLFLFLLNSYII